MKCRIEKDVLGEVNVPADSYGGSFYARASANFKISNLRAYESFGQALCLVKLAAARVNCELKVLDKRKAGAIEKACNEFLKRELGSEFYELDVYQAGAGTPFNMTLNEILANRANEILGENKGEYKLVHPNDHVNMTQSSNDSIPTAIRIASLMDLKKLYIAGDSLLKSIKSKVEKFKKYQKCGRTHLQDAVPMTLGQEFSAYASSLENAMIRIRKSSEELLFLGIGGTAIGSGINAHKDFAKKMCVELSELTGFKFSPAKNLFETTNSLAVFASLSANLKILANELLRITNDLRLMASGPNAGFNEIVLPEVEPGSSIMPGKVNPSVPECLSMICLQVNGLDHAINLACQQGQFQLNFHTPLIMVNLLHEIEILKNGMATLDELCIKGLKANQSRMKDLLESSTAYATILSPIIGYKKTAELVQESVKKKLPFVKVVPEKLRKYLD